MVYATTSGLWGVLVTDLFQFVLAMIGSVAAAYYAVTLPEVGGLSGLVTHSQRRGQAVAPAGISQTQRKS